RLPDRLQQAGVLADDQEQLRTLVSTYITYSTALEAERAPVMREHATGSSISVEASASLKHLAMDALHQFWMCFEVYLAAEAEAFGKVALVIVTAGVALNIYGKDASHGSPAMQLHKQNNPIALIMDAMQRCPIETYIALASHSKTVVAVGDNRQELYP
ncbi:MAG: hypothetical protein ACKPKO_42215, partial [Candidatus Fonsibacter sp.]